MADTGCAINIYPSKMSLYLKTIRSLKMPLTYNVWKYIQSIITCFRLYRTTPPFSRA